MTYSRYGLRKIRENNNPLYKDLLKRRDMKKIEHYTAPKFFVLTDEIIQSIDVEFVYWNISTRFYKLAAEHYGDPTLWWTIALFNKKPTDFHAKVGELIYIPTQWEIVYNAVIEGNEKFE